MKINVLVLFLLNAPAVQQTDADAAAGLINHLAGRWRMAGTLGGKQTIHDVDATWLLKRREYVQFHEVSRERGADGGPAYKAIVFRRASASRSCCAFCDAPSSDSRRKRPRSIAFTAVDHSTTSFQGDGDPPHFDEQSIAPPLASPAHRDLAHRPAGPVREERADAQRRAGRTSGVDREVRLLWRTESLDFLQLGTDRSLLKRRHSREVWK